MIRKATKLQVSFLLKQKGAIITFYILLALIGICFIENVLNFRGSDVLLMVQPMKLLFISYDRTNYNANLTLILIQLYPILVCCPAGFSLVREIQTGEGLLLISHLGKANYLFSKMLATFLTTGLIFTVPFLLEIGLNCISFPLNASGDLMGLNMYDPMYVESVRNYMFHKLYLFSPYMYAVVFTLCFGLISGLLGTFTMAFSALIRVKYRIFLFLPVFLLLNVSLYINSLFSGADTEVGWYHYMLLFDDTKKNIPVFIVMLLLLFIFSLTTIWIKSNKDSLQ